MGLTDFILSLEAGKIADFGSRADVLGRMNTGRRRMDLPVMQSSLQDLSDWVGAQFARVGDENLAVRSETVATEMFMYVVARSDVKTPQAASVQFRFLAANRCEISVIFDHQLSFESTAKRKTQLKGAPEPLALQTHRRA